MDEVTQLTAMLQVAVAQRNAAMDQVLQLIGQNTVLEQKIKSLEELKKEVE